MTYIIYADVMFFWNMVINAVLLYVTSKLLNLSIKPSRIIICSAITGLFLEIIYITTLNSNLIFHNLIYILMYIFMILTYFKCKTTRIFLRITVYMAISNFILFGSINIFSNTNTLTIKEITIFSVLIIILFSLFYKVNELKENKKIYNIEVNIMNNTITSLGFMDSGNMLSDYFTGNPVIILDYRILKSIFNTDTYKYLLRYCKSGVFDYETLKNNTNINFYPLPYRTISNNGALMPAFKLTSLSYTDYGIGYKNVVACISRYKLSHDNSYMVLLNEKIKPNREEYSND